MGVTKMNLTAEMARKWLILFNKKIQEKQDYLSNLDTPIGDGDHGHNMARGMTAVVAALNDNQTLQEVFKATAMALISKVGGASGPLYGTAFMEMAKTAATSDQLSDLLSAGLAGIIKRGGAQVGDKTMVDVWTPIVTEIQKGSLTKIEIEEFVMATADLLAKKGRASYVGERSIGQIDPGCQSSGFLFESLLEVIG
jgi:dihydroxyacetone kinase-like protein